MKCGKKQTQKQSYAKRSNSFHHVGAKRRIHHESEHCLKNPPKAHENLGCSQNSHWVKGGRYRTLSKGSAERRFKNALLSLGKFRLKILLSDQRRIA